MKILPFKTGMIYRSKTHPWFDMIVDYCHYEFNDKGNIEKYGTIICWCNINRLDFDNFIEIKLGKNRKSDTTFPYPWAGECSVKSLKQRIKKYNLEFCGMSEDETTVYFNNEFEFSVGFKEKFSKLSE